MQELKRDSTTNWALSVSDCVGPLMRNGKTKPERLIGEARSVPLVDVLFWAGARVP